MTNHWVDIKNADLVLIMGGNAAEAHPCGFKWVIEAKKNRGAKLVVVDPRFTRSAAVADFYAPIRVGSDIAFLSGVIHYLLSNDKINHEYVRAYTNASYLINEGYGFTDGLFSGYDEAKHSYDGESWKYQLQASAPPKAKVVPETPIASKDSADKAKESAIVSVAPASPAESYALRDETMQDPRCVLQVMKKHFAPYTPEVVSKVCGVPQADYERILEMIGECAQPKKVMTILYALGWTQHSVGSQNIRTMAMIQLLLGNIGVAGGGINALRGHSNVQGITDMCLFGANLPGYLTSPTDKEPDLAKFLETMTPKLMQPGQMNYWSNYNKFFVSLLKAFYGPNAKADNAFGYDWLPKAEGAQDVMALFERMHQGELNGFFCQGFNPLASVSHKAKIGQALARLKYLVIMDPLATETSEFWKPQGAYNDVKPAEVATEVFRLPANLFAEQEGSFTNSGRVIQWRWAGAEPPGEGKSDAEIMARLFLKLRSLYADGKGANAEPLMKLHWPYRIAHNPSPEELAKEVSGQALTDVADLKDTTKVLAKAGEQLASFTQLREDGSTACGNWLYCGSWSQAGNLMARRDNSDPSGLGQTLNWGFAWPANRRILYNRASCDTNGNPWDPERTVIRWAGGKWVGNDIPDIRVDAAPDQNVGPFIMNPEGVARLFAFEKMKDGPLPVHYEPFESPLSANPMFPGNPKAKNNPAARVFPSDAGNFGTPDRFPYMATTYRLVEHFHFWTKHSWLNAVTQPEQFVEIGEELAAKIGVRQGERVRVISQRGQIEAVAVVTKRIPTLMIEGKPQHTVGIPLHWGFKGVARPGYLANTLTPYVGDANVQTPEFKAFLVNIEKV